MIQTTSKVISTGDVYGRFSVLGIYREADPLVKQLFARVQCSCGSPPRYVRSDDLRNGKSQSCGCLHKERVTKHGAWGNPLYTVWKSMVDRCTNPANKKYPRYGGRGIAVCNRWHDIGNFIADMSQGYKKGLTIDRRDNDGNYEPDNCRWATAKQQTRNYSRNVVLEHDGRSLCAVDWAIEAGLPAKVLYDRISAGWTASRALTTPVKR